MSQVFDYKTYIYFQVFTFCMYGVGIIFYVFLYVFLIYPQAINYCLRKMKEWELVKDLEVSLGDWSKECPKT